MRFLLITAALLLATAAHAAPQLERADDNNQLVVVDKSLMGQLHQVRQTMVDRTSDLVVTAIGFLGVPYRRGGNTVETGFDCSGFVRAMYNQTVGHLLPRRAEEQAAATQKIDRNDLKPGDLVFAEHRAWAEARCAEAGLVAVEPLFGRPTGELFDQSPIGRIRRSNLRYLQRYRDEAALMGTIEQVSRYDEHVNAARMATMKHFAERVERTVVSLQRAGAVDARLDPIMAADALGAMVARFAELWLVQGYREYDFDQAVDQLTLLWANALGLQDQPALAKRRRR